MRTEQSRTLTVLILGAEHLSMLPAPVSYTEATGPSGLTFRAQWTFSVGIAMLVPYQFQTELL